jgi:hypothetical protein
MPEKKCPIVDGPCWRGECEFYILIGLQEVRTTYDDTVGREEVRECAIVHLAMKAGR